MNVRGYEGQHDLYAMLDLLSDGRRAKNGTHYVHRGDLQWWLFYTDVAPEVWQSHIRLWLEGEQGERLIGWALLSPEEEAFDVFTVPELRGDPLEGEMLTWAVDQMSATRHLQNVWVADDDVVHRNWLEENGFQCQERYMQYFHRILSGPLNGPPLPEGFSIRSSRGEEDAKLRSVCSSAAFSATRPFDEYWPRTLRFMQSPVYVPEHEIFVIAANGDVASYCIIWTDQLTKVGHFEPVGTHPDYQRKGLGKCLLYEGFRRLKAEGMQEADLCTNSDNPPAHALYESVGFRKAKRLLTYKKEM